MKYRQGPEDRGGHPQSIWLSLTQYQSHYIFIKK